MKHDGGGDGFAAVRSDCWNDLVQGGYGDGDHGTVGGDGDGFGYGPGDNDFGYAISNGHGEAPPEIAQ